MARKTRSPSVTGPMTATAMSIDIGEGKNRPTNTRGRAFMLWIIGLLVSLAPLIVVHFQDFFNNKIGFFFGLFSDIEIFFICVSMLVSASCEVNSQRKGRDILNGLLLVCIVFFALFYSKFTETTLDAATTQAIPFVALISLALTLVLGCVAYFSKRR